MPHIRVERVHNDGSKQISQLERIVAVGADGKEVDISACVGGWTLRGKWGQVEMLTLEVLATRVVTHADEA